jgi:hypothetical protein
MTRSRPQGIASASQQVSRRCLPRTASRDGLTNNNGSSCRIRHAHRWDSAALISPSSSLARHRNGDMVKIGSASVEMVA